MEVEDDFGLLLKKGVVEAAAAAFRVVIADVHGDIVARRGSGSTGRGCTREGERRRRRFPPGRSRPRVRLLPRSRGQRCGLPARCGPPARGPPARRARWRRQHREGTWRRAELGAHGCSGGTGAREAAPEGERERAWSSAGKRKFSLLIP